MTTYVATIHAPQPVTLEYTAANDEAAEFIAYRHTTAFDYKVSIVRHDVTPVGGSRSVSYDAIVKRLWGIAEGVGERDSLDTFALLVGVIKDIEQR